MTSFFLSGSLHPHHGAGDMGRADELFSAVRAVHEAGLDASRWSGALDRVAGAAGASAASLEIYDLVRGRHAFWEGVGVDRGLLDEYFRLFVDRPYTATGRAAGRVAAFPPGHVLAIGGRRPLPFYNDYLGGTDRRFLAVGVLDGDDRAQTVLTLRRDDRQGAMEPKQLDVLALLAPHVRLAIQTHERLREARASSRSLIEILDLLRLGVALLDADGRIVHVNAALASMARDDDGLRLGGDRLRLASSGAGQRLQDALASVSRLREETGLAAPATFAAPRPSGEPAYIVSLRPLCPSEADEAPSQTVSVMFVRDPLWSRSGSTAAEDLQAAYGLTSAEAALAEALVQGVSPNGYARRRGVSINTAYTHLRRLKDKTGAHRLADLIARLSLPLGETTPYSTR